MKYTVLIIAIISLAGCSAMSTRAELDILKQLSKSDCEYLSADIKLDEHRVKVVCK
jgi:hypothetical protein